MYIFIKTKNMNTFIQKNVFVLGIVFLAFFTTCKKYPENDLWFKNPKRIAIINGYIYEYKVNYIDSLNGLNAFYKPVIPSWPYPYNKIDRDIRKEHFIACCRDNNHWDITCDLFERVDYSISQDKKRINIGAMVDTNYYKKNIFVSKFGDIDWDIIYLNKDGKKSKIRTTYNGNMYEITFEN